MAVGEPADAEVARGGHSTRSGLLHPAGGRGILLPAGFVDMVRWETPVRAAGGGIVESAGARDPSCSPTGEDEPYNRPLAVSSA